MSTADSFIMRCDSSYDPNESRVLNPIADVILRCRITASPGSTVCLRVSSGGDLFTIELDPDRARAELVHNQTTAATTALPCESLRRGATLDLVLADHRLTLAVDDRPILAYRYQPFGAGSEVQPSRVAIGARGPEVKLRDLQILRDIYYTTGPDPGGETAGTYRLGPDEYFLLGDNSPHSLDSRVWSSHSAVTAPLIVGRALKW